MLRRPLVLLLLALPLFAQEPREDAYLRGYNLFKQGKLSEAEAAFQSAYNQTPPDLRGLLGLTEVYAAQNKFDRALKILEEHLEKSGPSKNVKTAWGNIAVRAGRYDDAVAVFQDLLRDDPANFDLHMRLAESFRSKSDLPNAIQVWEKATLLNRDSLAPVLARAIALDQLGRKSEAVTAYTEVLRRDPSHKIANNNVAYYLAGNNTDLDRALQYATAAAAGSSLDPDVADTISPFDPEVADTLAFVRLKRNEPAEAAAIYKRLTAQQPKRAVFHIRYAQALRMSGDAPGAKRECDLARPLLTPAEQTEFQAHCPDAQ